MEQVPINSGCSGPTQVDTVTQDLEPSGVTPEV